MTTPNLHNLQASWLIAFGALKPPQVPGTENEQKLNQIDVSNVFSAEDKRRFCDAVAVELRAGVFRKADIIANIEADEEDFGIEIIPRGIRTKKKPSHFYLEFLIGIVKKELNLYQPTKSEEIVFLALAGKTRKESQEITGHSRGLVADVYNALGLHIPGRKKIPESEASFVDLCNQAKIKFYAQKEQEHTMNDFRQIANEKEVA